jgi:hypothetical protein
MDELDKTQDGAAKKPDKVEPRRESGRGPMGPERSLKGFRREEVRIAPKKW